MNKVVNDFSITVGTVNGSGSQTANTTILRALFKMGIPVSGKNLFWGLVQTVTADPVATYRIWKVHAVDWNWLLPLALVGTPYAFYQGYAPTDIACVDPNAQISGGSDAGAFRGLFLVFGRL